MPITSSWVKDAYGDVHKEVEDKKADPVEEPEEQSFDIPYTFGYIPDPPDERDYEVSSLMTGLESAKSVDYSNQMSSVKDQGSKGSCVGFAVAAMLEWQQQQEYLREKESGSYYTRDEDHYDLSEQWIYHKAKEIDPFPEDTSGTTIRAALKVVSNVGVPVEEGWKYDDHIIGKPKFWAYSVARWSKSKNYYKIGSIAEMKRALQNVGPFVAGVLVFPEWGYPRNGKVRYPSNPRNVLGGHAICIVGYDDTRKLFKFKNSWGTGWGQNGYGYLPYRYMRDFTIISWISIDDDIKEI